MSEVKSDWPWEVTNWAEFEKGLDPIGSGDILSDLYEFTRNREAEQGQTSPEQAWDEFTQSDTFKRYGLKPW